MLAGVAGLLLLLQPVTPVLPERRPPIADALAAAAMPPLTGDAFRFADIPAGGGAATVFEARRSAGAVQRTIVSLTGDAAGWTVTSRETRRLAAETFDYMAGRIDAAIGTGAAEAAPCADGSDYLSQRATGGVVRSLHGCGPDHPNIALARLFGVGGTP